VASLSTLRGNTLVYLGTTSADKAFPPATLNLLINNAVNALLDDIGEMNPAWLRLAVTLAAQSSTSHLYTLPADFSGWLEVKLDNADGAPCTEVRDDELDSTGGYVFSIIGSDHAATLTTGSTISQGNPLYLKYKAWPVDLAADADQPDMIPRKYHDVIALYAAEEGMGLGGEGALPATLIRRKEDRHAQLMMHVARRGVEVAQTRGSAPQWDD
jgi:hypothetical protein